MIFGFCTLGCKVNQYETQAMEQLLVSEGHTVAPFGEKCDVYIINTCSVTAVADKKNRAIIRRCRKANPDGIIAVCGCYPQRDADAVAAFDAGFAPKEKKWMPSQEEFYIYSHSSVVR